MAQPYVQFHNLTVGYNKIPVISNMNLEIDKGEIVALIGPNGAGKSTILKSMSRSLDIISGQIYLDGRKLGEYSYKELSKKMAVILTDKIKSELLTCRDIVSTGRYPYTGRLGLLTAEDEKIVTDAMQSVNALELSECDFNEISDGQKQRVLLARAIAQEPEIILLDEPTSFLDIRYKLELLSILTRMAHEKKITVVTSLHEIDLAEKVADKIVTIKGEKVFASGTAEEIFREDNIRELYEIDKGYFDPLMGNIELQKPAGDKPAAFVIAGHGSGIPVYRKLQKKNIAFATGVFSEGDIDYRLARLYAVRTITTENLNGLDCAAICEPLMRNCEYIIDAGADTPQANMLRRIAAGMKTMVTAEKIDSLLSGLA